MLSPGDVVEFSGALYRVTEVVSDTELKIIPYDPPIWWMILGCLILLILIILKGMV